MQNWHRQQREWSAERFKALLHGVLHVPSQNLGTWAATFQDRPPFPESCESAKDREISGTRLLKGCDHPSKGLLLGDISEESREAAAWTLILLGAF